MGLGIPGVVRSQGMMWGVTAHAQVSSAGRWGGFREDKMGARNGARCRGKVEQRKAVCEEQMEPWDCMGRREGG